MKLVPTINFGGNCREAIYTYERAFGGRINCLITYGEADDPAYNPLLKEGQGEYIYHSELLLGGEKTLETTLGAQGVWKQRRRYSGRMRR